MNCPADNTTLVMSERNGIEIDYCPECRGVWLDRGELDKIIERAGAAQPAAMQQPLPPQYVAQSYQQGRSSHHGNSGYGNQPNRRRKENWLSDLFD